MTAIQSNPRPGILATIHRAETCVAEDNFNLTINKDNEFEDRQDWFEKLKGAIGSLCHLQYTVHRRKICVRVNQVKVDVVDEQSGGISEIKAGSERSKRMSKSSWNGEVHGVFKKLDANTRQIRKFIESKSLPTANRGSHLIHVAPDQRVLLEAKLIKLRDQRHDIAREYFDSRYEIMSLIRDQCPEQATDLIRRLPQSLEDAVRLHDFTWSIFKVASPENPESFMQTLPRADRARIEKARFDMHKEIAENEVKVVFDGLFGELHNICKDAANGGFSTGRRKDGCFNSLMECFERALDFEKFTDMIHPEMVADIRRAKNAISRIPSVKKLNSDSSYQEAVKAALAPIKVSIEEARKSQGYARKTRFSKIH